MKTMHYFLKTMMIASLIGLTVMVNAMTITGKITPANAITNNGGSIVITIKGNSGPVKYLWSNKATTQNITNLSVGTYSVTVSDNSKTKAVAKFTVNHNSQPIPDLIKPWIVKKCKGAQVTVTASIAKNLIPNIKGWRLKVGTQYGAIISNSTIIATDKPGLYSFELSFPSGYTVKDSVLISDVDVKRPVAILGKTSVTVKEITTYKLSSPDTDKNSGYSYRLSILDNNGTILTSSKSISVIATWGSTPGVGYVVCETFTPEQCADSMILKVAINAAISNTLKVTGKVTQADSKTKKGGAIDITVSGGTAPYKYTWSNKATTEDLKNLSAGTYTVIVKDSKLHSVTSTFIVTNKIIPIVVDTVKTDSLAIKDSINATSTGKIIVTGKITQAESVSKIGGSIDITVVGGTAPYIYTWSNNAKTEDLINIPVGTYTVTVKDSKQRSATATFVITNKTTPIILDSTKTNSSKLKSDSYSIDTISSSVDNVILNVLSEVPVITLYPNPATNQITLSVGPEPIENIIIYSLDGKQLIQTKDQTITISQLINGTYKLLVVTKTQARTLSFIKQ